MELNERLKVKEENRYYNIINFYLKLLEDQRVNDSLERILLRCHRIAPKRLEKRTHIYIYTYV